MKYKDRLSIVAAIVGIFHSINANAQSTPLPPDENLREGLTPEVVLRLNRPSWPFIIKNESIQDRKATIVSVDKLMCEGTANIVNGVTDHRYFCRFRINYKLSNGEDRSLNTFDMFAKIDGEWNNRLIAKPRRTHHR